MKKTIKKIERKSSLESEPRTLSLDQIQYARDAALYVVKNKSFEDAIRIFTEVNYYISDMKLTKYHILEIIQQKLKTSIIHGEGQLGADQAEGQAAQRAAQTKP
ncbi:hypothetical protein QJS10_CPB19g00006 [Acorus calamus]|uniref:Uncharacterized protein n=1 Tax=Acorus calamus TaxID=4465 RepID=A0AAV9CDQ6_ACOCL|nr:hypothetical protein QJS10_CPB19g00006 [Acorus calamus]